MVPGIEQLLNKYWWNARTNARRNNTEVRGLQRGELLSRPQPPAGLLTLKGLLGGLVAQLSLLLPSAPGGFLPHLLLPRSWGPRPVLSLPWHQAQKKGNLVALL